LLSPDLVGPIEQLAHEGVPIKAIARAFQVPSEDTRSHLKDAMRSGTIIELPAEEWPNGSRSSRNPTVTDKLDSLQQILRIRTVFKLTAQQAIVFSTLLSRPIATKEQLLTAIQQHRLTKKPLPSNLEEPQLKLIDVLICNMRKRLADILDAPPERVIETVWGVGYMIPEEHRVSLSAKLKS